MHSLEESQQRRSRRKGLGVWVTLPNLILSPQYSNRPFFNRSPLHVCVLCGYNLGEGMTVLNICLFQRYISVSRISYNHPPPSQHVASPSALLQSAAVFLKPLIGNYRFSHEFERSPCNHSAAPSGFENKHIASIIDTLTVIFTINLIITIMSYHYYCLIFNDESRPLKSR